MVLAVAALLVVGVGLMVLAKFVLNWFSQLNADSQARLAESHFDDPISLKPAPCPSVFSEPSKTLSVVIPAYNEEDRLPATLVETLSYLQRRRDRHGAFFTYEVIVVDDGSKDGTVKKAFEFVRQHGLDAVRVLRLPRNRGKGAAVKAGCLHARGRRVLFMDADGATQVSDMERLEARLAELSGGGDADGGGNGGAGAAVGAAASPTAALGQQRRRQQPQNGSTAGGSILVGKGEGLGFVLGSRAALQEATTAKRTAVRNFLMHGFHFLVTLAVGSQIRDTQCGFKMMTRRTAQQLFSNQRLQRWCFDVELVYLAQRLKVPMAEVQVNWTEVPGSKIRPTSMVHMALELAAIRLGYGLGLWAVRGEEELGKQQ